VPPDSLVALQIQKLADHSDMISEVPKSKSALDPAGGAYSASPEPIANGEGLAAPYQEPHPALGPSGLVCMGLRGLITEFATLLMIDFKCRPI